MKDKPGPEHINRFVEELVECGVQLGSILDHMYRHESEFPGAPPPPIVLRNLVAGKLAPGLKGQKKAVQKATTLLQQASETIARDIFVVEPGSFDDLDPDFLDEPFDPSASNGFHPDPERLH